MYLTAQDRFDIGDEALLPSATTNQAEAEIQEDTTGDDHRDAIENIRIHLGTLLKTESVSLLLGAGASVNCGGQLIGTFPRPVEQDLVNRGTVGTDPARVQRWLKVLFLAVRCSGGDIGDLEIREAILARREALNTGSAAPLAVNFEQVLATLHQWHYALSASGGSLQVGGAAPGGITANDAARCLDRANRSLARVCHLPTTNSKAGLEFHKALVRKLLTRPLNLKRVNVFTLNYDTLVEQASDAVGAVLLDGFVGTQCRVFRPESYEQDLYFPAETTEGRVHRFDRVLHLYKLHGSITWTANPPTMEDPYGVRSGQFDPDDGRPLLIYPTPAKYGETLGLPYSELFRRFSRAIARPQSVLFVIGYGFGDAHVNTIIRQALAVPSFTLVIVDPKPQSEFVTDLRSQHDRRIWVSTGPTLGTLAGFVDHVLPDLQDEEIRKKVLATYNALAKSSSTQGDTANGS